MADLFSGLEPFKLTQVQLTDRVLGCGSYATVYEVLYNGKKCAGKEIHKLLQQQGNTSYTLQRFKEECHILSCLHHPNIVRFYGVYFREMKRVPILIMEFLPMNLTSCIEKRGILPEEISYSILHGVALGLCYLHHQDPPVIHRDLSANNILLTCAMEAKISDFGVARMLNLTPLQVSHMTETPGTPAYMPPEVMVANPIYDTSVDEFSFGIMMIHIFSGKWPEPQCSPIRIEGGKMIPVSEAQRRDVFLQVVGYNHPLMELILKCISNDPQQRVHVDVILKMLETVQKMSTREKSKAYEADSSKEAWQSNNEDHKTEGEETMDYSTDNHRRMHQGSDIKQNQQNGKCLATNSGRTCPASPESEYDNDIMMEKQSKKEESGMLDLCQPICVPTHSKGKPTSVMSTGFSHLRDFMANKVALTPKLHKLTDFFTHAASSQQQKSISEPCTDREVQMMAATTKSVISTDQEEEQRRMPMIEAVEEGDIVFVTMSPPQTKKHHKSQVKTSDEQSLLGSSSKSMPPVEQLYMFDEDLPSLTWTQSQEVEQGPIVPVQHTSSQDLGDSVTLSTSASVGANSKTALKHSPPTQSTIQSSLADTCYSSSVYQLPQSRLSLPQVSDLTMGSSAPELTSIAQRHMTMIDDYDEETASVSADNNSGAYPTQAKKHREIKTRMTLQAISSRSRSPDVNQGTIVPTQQQEMTSLHEVGGEVTNSTGSEFANISLKQDVVKFDDFYEESTSLPDSDDGAYLEESQVSTDWYRLCGNQILHSQMMEQKKRLPDSPPTSPAYDDSIDEETDQSPIANIWVPISFPDYSQHSLHCVCLSDMLLWIIDSTGSVYCMRMEPPLSQDQPWQIVKGYMHQISSSSSGNNVWGVHSHNAYMRLGIGLNPEGTQWRNVTSNTQYANRIKLVAVDESAVWAVSTNGKLLFRKDVGQAYPEGKTWQEVKNDLELPQLTFRFVACCCSVVWAVTTSGKVLCRTGIAHHVPSGRKWKEVKVPKLVSISITSEGMVWGVSENNAIGFRCGVSVNKPSGKGPWWEICIDALSKTPVVSHTGTSIIDTVSSLIDNLSFLELNNFVSISASYKSGVVVLDQKGRHLHACRKTITGFYYTLASSSDLFWSMNWSKTAAGGTALWLTSSIDGDLYSLSKEALTRVECPVRVKQIAASPSCMWILSEDSIWSRQMLSMKVPEGIAFDRIELSAELQCAQLRHVACGKNSAWAVDSNGVPHFRFAVQRQEPGAMSPAWMSLEDNPHPLTMITVSPNDCLVWACDEYHNVYARIGVTPDYPVGKKWELIPEEQAKELCAENTKIYALTPNNELIYRYGIDKSNAQGNYWRKMPGRFEHIAVGETGDLWTVDGRGKVWKQEQMVVTVASSHVVKPTETTLFDIDAIVC